MRLYFVRIKTTNMISLLVIFGCLVVSSFGEEAVTCPENEQVHLCANAVSWDQTCSGIGKPITANNFTSCTQACKCVSGYLRAENGTCIPWDQCPEIACPENELRYSCANAISEGTCSDLGKPPTVNRNHKSCKPGCRCRLRHYRANNGTCIPRDQCPGWPVAPRR